MAISAGQRQRIGRAAAYWLRRNGWATGYDLRADAIFIAPRRWPLHLENAFELDLG
jgi:putative endonuclease